MNDLHFYTEILIGSNYFNMAVTVRSILCIEIVCEYSSYRTMSVLKEI